MKHPTTIRKRASSKKNCSRRSGCPLNVTVEILGDLWSLLVVRDLMFKGARSFKDLMASDEGIASNILTDRLNRLMTMEIITRKQMRCDRRKYIYLLTHKGIDLGPVLVEMIVWGARYEKTQAPPTIVREMESQRDKFLLQIRKTWQDAVKACDPHCI